VVDTDETTKLAAKTWSGEWWKYGGGGTPWNAITYDAEFSQVLVGTGNGGPWNPRFRCETQDGKLRDNLFVASVVALDAKTGRYKWHYQYNPCEASDWKATMDIILANLTINSQPRKVMMQAPSNGFFYVIDRSNGTLISAEKIGKVNWADRIDLKTGRPVERPGIRYEDAPVTLYPSAFGAHDWQAMSYSPDTGLVYIPYIQLGMTMSPSAAAQAAVTANPKKLIIRLGVNAKIVADPKDPLDGKGSLLAWDPIVQKVKWRVDYPFFWNGGTMTTAGNLVFQGTITGGLYAYESATGKRLWSFDAKLGILAPPITFKAKGNQYVSILVGYGASADGAIVGMHQGWKYGLQPRRLLTFVLDGKAILPETPPPDFSVNAVDAPKLVLDPHKVELGMAVFHQSCSAGCHGTTAMAAGGAPDLRESGVVLDRQAFGQFLRDAPLLAFGMARFDDLSDAEVDELYQYIRSEARNYLAGKSMDSRPK
jgi:quinohemoprotein ethanol dehydrogenase